ncbi:hypothetical protein ABT352_01560 [Streptosporangium sp. NPDC000563]|uniref:hypothetical protein n=1 Tax=Streptosporangium sp. NPDC000563 TaxID=3154366 RepID=UPI0033196B7E
MSSTSGLIGRLESAFKVGLCLTHAKKFCTFHAAITIQLMEHRWPQFGYSFVDPGEVEFSVTVSDLAGHPVSPGLYVLLPVWQSESTHMCCDLITQPRHINSGIESEDLQQFQQNGLGDTEKFHPLPTGFAHRRTRPTLTCSGHQQLSSSVAQRGQRICGIHRPIGDQ